MYCKRCSLNYKEFKQKMAKNYVWGSNLFTEERIACKHSLQRRMCLSYSMSECSMTN